MAIEDDAQGFGDVADIGAVELGGLNQRLGDGSHVAFGDVVVVSFRPIRPAYQRRIAVPGCGAAAGKASYMNSGWMLGPDKSLRLNTPFSGFTRLKQINEYETIRYVGPFDRSLALATGEIGTILDDYGDGNYEVEFSLPDGTAWLQCALPGEMLQPELKDEPALKSLPSQSAIYPAILAFERGEAQAFCYLPTGETLSVQRTEDGRIVVATPSLGNIATVTRPEK